ncbi:MAG: hypothetical protein O7C63_08995 [Alphaproteobacteria bacterium]|nr:hypothetical protein [Alphaproteobacteria bacterium]
MAHLGERKGTWGATTATTIMAVALIGLVAGCASEARAPSRTNEVKALSERVSALERRMGEAIRLAQQASTDAAAANARADRMFETSQTK